MRDKLFITFEGIDGSGKSTQIELLAEKLRKDKVDFLMTREPGGSFIGKNVREILLEKREHELEPLTEVMLLMADRFQHLKDKIKPALEKEKIVLCDRFFDSTLAYQGGGRNLDLSWLRDFFSKNGFEPHLTFYLKILPETALERLKIRKKQTALNRIDEEGLNFFAQVSESYESLIEENPLKFRVIDGAKPIEKISNEIYEIFKREVLKNV